MLNCGFVSATSSLNRCCETPTVHVLLAFSQSFSAQAGKKGLNWSENWVIRGDISRCITRDTNVTAINITPQGFGYMIISR